MSMSTTPFEKDFIRQHLISQEPKHLLEIGAFKGATTRVLFDAAVHRGGQLVVIDPMSWSSEAVRNGLARHLRWISISTWDRVEQWMPRMSYEEDFWETVGTEDYERLRLYRARSTDKDLLQRQDPELRNFDFVFVDGDHSYDGARSDLENWGSRVKKGGWVLVHDAIPRFSGVIDAIRAWTSNGASCHVRWPERGTICAIEILG